MTPFRERTPLDERRRLFAEVCARRPTHIPVIVEWSRDAPAIDRDKFLVRADLTAAQFSHVLRRRLALAPSQALFLLADGKIMSGNTTLSDVRHRSPPSDDGFLYVVYSLEHAFGM